MTFESVKDIIEQIRLMKNDKMGFYRKSGGHLMNQVTLKVINSNGNTVQLTKLNLNEDNKLIIEIPKGLTMEQSIK